jgi:hypothetical protein
MDFASTIEQLRRGGEAIAALVGGIDEAQARWKPAADRWSILEVINHLADEEREDFRTRLEITLRDPSAEWPSLDPEGIVVTRRYNERALTESVLRFEEERLRTLTWLESLVDPQLERSHAHARFGSLAAGDLLASWAAHDLLHIRQIARLELEYLVMRAAPFSTAYAGPLT